MESNHIFKFNLGTSFTLEFMFSVMQVIEIVYREEIVRFEYVGEIYMELMVVYLKN